MEVMKEQKSWSILYRGSLTSCNYACDYCPFAKTKNTREELQKDKEELFRFVDWVRQRKEQIGVLFTPWGEGLIRKYYQEAMTELSHMSNVNRVAIQTNLSCRTDWLKQANKNKIALWTTYHPTESSIPKFIDKCKALDEMEIRYSVGFVGFKDQMDILRALRKALDPSTYLWVNAYKREANYYSPKDIQAIEEIDPLFQYNNQYHPSLGQACRAGETVFSVDGDGNMFRCHFIKTQIGNIYAKDFESGLVKRPCTNESCGCHIGYVHMETLPLYETFGTGVLERIPKQMIWGGVV